MRGTVGSMIDRVVGHHYGSGLAQWTAGIWIHVEAREVGGRDIEPDTMAAGEEITYRVARDAHLVDLARRDRRRVGPRLAKAHPDDRVGQVERVAVGIIR